MIEINEIVIQVPGMNESQATQLGNDVAERMAIALPEGLQKNMVLPELNLSVHAGEGMNADTMAELIASKLVKQLTGML